MGRKQWVKQQAQEYQDYVHVAETLEALVVAAMEKNGMEYYVHNVINTMYVIRRTIVNDVVS